MSAVDGRRFRKDGYVLIKGLFDAPAIEDCLDEMRVIFDQLAVARGLAPAAGQDPASLSRTMTALFAADMTAYLAAAKLAQHMVSLHRMGASLALTDVLKALGLKLPVISTRPVLFIMADALKVPGGYHKTPPHQDFRSIQGSLDGVVVWTPFADVTAGGYALEVMPASHRLGLLPSAEDSFGHRVQADLPDEGFVPLEVGRGDAVVFSTLLVHRTGAVGGQTARIAASFRFNNACEPGFADRLYPNPYVYRPDLTLISEAVATPAAVAGVFGTD